MSKKEGKILIIDDDKDILYTANILLNNYFTCIETESNPSNLFTHLKKHHWDVIILDMNFRKGETSGKEGLDLLQKIIRHNQETHVLMMTAYGDIELAVEAMKLNATDFIVKPWYKEKFLASVHAIYELSISKRKISELRLKQQDLRNEINRDFSEIISVSNSMKKIFDTIQRISSTDANVLILGENGTGKELIARKIHDESLRNEEPFIKVDLGAIPDTLFESELFGHKKGAFTDAKEDKAGKLEIANKGTLFLDEIGNLPMNLQSKILSVLQNRHIVRVGSNNIIDVDFRLICATNMPLLEMIEKKEFRQDLFYRINTIEITIPQLRERKEDIKPIVNHYLDKFKRKYNKFNLTISNETIKALEKYQWPGNIRELIHSTERAILMCETNILQANDFLVSRASKTKSYTDSCKIEEVEKSAIQKALQKHKGNYTKASEELGWVRSTLYRKRKKYGF
ncbi:sigma-54-dependent transcriptional regulator [Bacteroidota bacterium]